MSSRRLKKSRFRKLNVERLCSRQLLAGDMTNPGNALDANNDKEVSPLDALVIINYLGQPDAAGAGEGEPVSSLRKDFFPDTNGDSDVSASDALRVINSLVEGEHLGNAPVVRSFDLDTGSSPQIEFSGDNVFVTVTSPEHGLLRFDFEGESETISIEHDLIIEASGSGNRILFDGAWIPDDLIIRVSGENNGAALVNSYVGDDFVYKGGHGTDGIYIGSDFNGEILEAEQTDHSDSNGDSHSSFATRIEDTVVVYGKDGDDWMLAEDAYVGNDFLFFGGNQNDTFAAERVKVGDDAIVNLGDHDDVLSAIDILVHDVVNVNGGDHFDSIAVDNVMADHIHENHFETEGFFLNVSQLAAEFFNFGPVLGTGDVQVTLRWTGDADLDLHVIDPTGFEIDFSDDTSPSGGQLDFDIVPGCGSGSAPRVENVFWPTGGAPSGTYEAFVDAFDVCGGPVDYVIEMRIDGVLVASDSGTLTSDGQDSPSITGTKSGSVTT